MHTPKDIALLWFEAFNAHNIENLLALYADNAEHYSPKLKVHRPETNGLIRGKSALRVWWTDAFVRLPNYITMYCNLLPMSIKYLWNTCVKLLTKKICGLERY
jgi:hypothetical protein